MNTLLVILLAALAAIFVGCLHAFGRGRGALACNGFGKIRTRATELTLALDAAVAQRYLLAKLGDGTGDADICGATDAPIGYFDDEGAIGDHIKVQFGADKTHFGIAAVAIAKGDPLFTTAAGKVTDTAVNNSRKVGIALTAVSAGEATAGGDSAIVEYLPQGYGEVQTV